MIIRGFCWAMLDGAQRTTWPMEFAMPPRVGERVAVGWLSLTIASVTHATDDRGRPIVGVELRP